MIGTASILNTQTPLASRNWSVYVRSKRIDPTNTTVLRKRFESEMDRKFNRVKQAIIQAIVTRDVFGLKPQTNSALLNVNISGINMPAPGAFAFPTSAQKVEAFMTWMRQLIASELLTVSQFQQTGQAVNPAWTNMYIQDSYERGIARAKQELKKAGYTLPLSDSNTIGASFNTPFHMDRVGLLYSRTFNDLKGITDIMDSQISRTLGQGMIDGDGPLKIARKMRAVIEGGGNDLGIKDTLGRFIPAQKRAKTLARTEMMRAFHQANVQEMKNWGVEGVNVQAEWSTAEDDRVCEECKKMAEDESGNIITYTMDEIQNLIPKHPNCRCLALPILAPEKQAKKELKEKKEGKKKVVEQTQKPKKEKIKKVKPSVEEETETTQKISKEQVKFNNEKDQQKYNELKAKYDFDIENVLENTDENSLSVLKELINVGGPFIDERKYISNFQYGANKALEDLRNLYMREIPYETRSAMTYWQGSTNNRPCLTLKHHTSKLEQGAGEVKFSKRWLEDHPGNKIIAKNISEGKNLDISTEDYIKLRAFNQSLMEALGRNHDFVLYRGTGGSKGASLRKSFSQKGMHRTKATIEDNSLAGYSESDAIAYKFGINDGGISVRIKCSYKEVVVDKLLLSFMNNKFWDEMEILIVSGDRIFNIEDVIYSKSQGGFK